MISIGIPVYNGDRFLEKTILSILAQSMQDFEIIIADDASTDGSLEIIDQYTRHDKRIRVIRNQKRLGIEGNWNAVLNASQCDWIKIVCQDDPLFPKCLETQMEVFRCDSSGKIALVCCRRAIINAMDKQLLVRGFDREGYMAGKDAIRQIVKAGTNLIGEPGSVLFRKEISHKAGMFNGKLPYGIDTDYWCRMLQLGDLYVIADVLSTFRISDQSLSYRLLPTQLIQAIRCLRSIALANPAAVSMIDLWQGYIRAALQVMGRKVYFSFYTGS